MGGTIDNPLNLTSTHEPDLEFEVSVLRKQLADYDRLFEMAGKQMDQLIEQLETKETIINRQKDIIKELKRDVDLAFKQRNALLEAITRLGFTVHQLFTPPKVAEPEQTIEGVCETVSDKGQDSGETQICGQTGGESEGLLS